MRVIDKLLILLLVAAVDTLVVLAIFHEYGTTPAHRYGWSAVTTFVAAIFYIFVVYDEGE